jgi:hypothetical protein
VSSFSNPVCSSIAPSKSPIPGNSPLKGVYPLRYALDTPPFTARPIPC